MISMALTPEDLKAIRAVIKEELESHLSPVKSDLAEIKRDTKLLSKLNYLDAVRGEPRLRKLYSDDEELKEM
jgi:hypothetical protein